MDGHRRARGGARCCAGRDPRHGGGIGQEALRDRRSARSGPVQPPWTRARSDACRPGGWRGSAARCARAWTTFAHLRGLAPHAPVVLAAGEGALLYLLAGAIRAWQAQRGVAPLKILSRDRDATLEAVRSGQAHAGVAVLDAAP